MKTKIFILALFSALAPSSNAAEEENTKIYGNCAVKSTYDYFSIRENTTHSLLCASNLKSFVSITDMGFGGEAPVVLLLFDANGGTEYDASYISFQIKHASEIEIDYYSSLEESGLGDFFGDNGLPIGGQLDVAWRVDLNVLYEENWTRYNVYGVVTSGSDRTAYDLLEEMRSGEKLRIKVDGETAVIDLRGVNEAARDLLGRIIESEKKLKIEAQ